MIYKKLIPIILLGLLFSGCSNTSSDTQNPPNFLLILTDDQSWVGTSFLTDPDDERTKSDFYQTPNMERIAKSGMRFTNGYSPAPYCCPTRRSITIGQTPAKHEYQKDREGWTVRYREQLSIPRMLKEADPDYMTAHFGKWDSRYDEVTPEEMGYDISDGPTTNGTGGGRGSEWPQIMDDPKLIFSLTDRACNFMETQVEDDKPFYLQLSHYAVHLGINFTQESIDKYRDISKGDKHFVPEFAAMTEDLDAGIGILLDKLEELGIMDNTYLIFMSDNGGRNSIPIGPDQEMPRNYPLRDGKGSMYEGGIRVPFVIVGPGVKENSASDVPVSGLDILPTLADLAGYPEQLPDVLDGGSISPVIHNGGKGEVNRQRSFMVFHHAVNRSPQSAIREGNFKLVKTWKKERIELFDLSKDISEANNLVLEYPEKAKDMEEKLVNFLIEVGAETRETE